MLSAGWTLSWSLFLVLTGLSLGISSNVCLLELFSLFLRCLTPTSLLASVSTCPFSRVTTLDWTVYNWQWLSCPATINVLFPSLNVEQFITTLEPVSCLVTSSATNFFPSCDNSNISWNGIYSTFMEKGWFAREPTQMVITSRDLTRNVEWK